MKKLILMALLLVSAVDVCADGIPYDRETGRMTVPYQRIVLSEEQMAEYRAAGDVTLSISQHEKILSKAAKFPRTIRSVLRYTHSDCTCCVGRPYAIMLPGGYELALPEGEIHYFNEYGTRDPVKFEFSKEGKDVSKKRIGPPHR